MMIRRFTPVQRLFHLSLILTFMMQTATGFGRLYIETAWGKWLAGLFGGYTGCLAVHKWVGILMLVLFLLHIVYAVVQIARGKMRGQDSLLPRLSDIGEFLRHTAWIFGLARQPRFDRWTWWEKFDYWAVFWGMVILGSTGLILFDSLVSSRVIMGWGINVALWVHRVEAILAILHVVLIHFFVAHLRRSHFPMDKAMFEGGVEVDAAKEHRPAWIERLKAGGDLEGHVISAVPTAMRAVYFVFGYAVVVIGALLVIYALINAPRVTW
ncbi:formate dehydrogenase subunit gamma [Desulfovibrio ferrophilus]|uniref:Deca-heme C-type cytochrome n=1 Tax=Desulfovibrio ferrophilus TaxID=241368 RepID=A0A2Z6AZN5_9BACT|nr:cytochrome b/b6 domain-containing protein [Desulfovibrio ferrophilus]BBD08616.1 Deca-heme C-type cytochrome [Desulfovibrio ferrophilus]